MSTVIDHDKAEEYVTTNNQDDDDVLVSEVKANLLDDVSKAGSKGPSKRALKRQARAQQFKELKKRRKAENLIQTGREDAGYNLDEFDKTSYYFENGLRKVYPYHFVFTTHAKGRWVGRTLKNVLEKEFGFNEPEDVDKAFDQGKIHVNGKKANFDYKVKDCDYISHQIHRHENPVTDSPFEILADTGDVVVINKPSSIPCHPCGRYRFNSVVFILGKELGYSNLRNIYRLDRLTSGVLVLGKTAEATKKLEDQVVNRQVQKEYVCRVVGEFPSETLTVDQPLQALSNKLRLQVVAPKGKASQTTFTRLSYNGRSSVVKCVPHTGRTHQIRVHLQYLGYPIINDVFYNSSAWGPNKAKGGVYEVSNDIVCATILKRHQATQWDGGEHPRFHEKLKEMQQQKEQSIVLVPENMHSVTGTNSQDKNVTKTSEKNPENHTPSLKHDRSVSDSEVNSSEGDSSTFKSLHHSSNILDTTNDRISSNVDDNIATVSKEEGLETQRRACFDWSKWQVEASCDLCRRATIDPRPRDLVMFLHAWKYKGPDWEYQTSLPDWAHEDWQDEDQYMLEEGTDAEAVSDSGNEITKPTDV